MFFDAKPRDLGIGSFAKGDPAMLGEIWDTTVDANQKVDNDFAQSQALEDDYNQRADRLSDTRLPRR